MKKLIFIVLAIFACQNMINAQEKVLEIEDKSSVKDVYPCEDRKEMKAIFITPIKMPLTFSTNYQGGKHIDIISQTVDTVNDNLEYHLIFPTELRGSSLDARKLTIMTPGFDPYVIPNFNGAPKTVKTIRVKDPYAKSEHPFYIALNKADEYYNVGNYIDAKTQYSIAMQYPEYQDEAVQVDVEGKIAAIDSLMAWHDKAKDANNGMRYMEALSYYKKILDLNPNDEVAKTNSQDCANKQATDCGTFYRTAEELFNDDQLSEAKTYYQSVINLDCMLKTQANDKILMINKILESRRNRNHTFTIEHGTVNNLWGFTSATYKLRKFGGYFSLHLNGDVLDSFRDTPTVELEPEGNIHFGWTHAIHSPVWFHFGFGYTGKGQFTLRESGKDVTNPEDLERGDFNFKWYSAVSPEVGLMFKIWHINIRYTYQYRFALKSEDDDFIGKDCHYIGVGFNW